jgi:8-oxo-dGTP diphosphatase
MPLSDQKINSARYQVIPRVLIFAFQPDAVLMIKLLPRKGIVTTWTGKYNGPGGHVERGEDLLAAAKRELLEETGLTANITLCGTVMVDTGPIAGVGLFIFRADDAEGELLNSMEGIPEWIPFERLEDFPLVEDVAIFLERIRQMKRGDPPFAGHSFYDENDQLTVVFS